MKTRQEMIYDFMVALASNGKFFDAWNKTDIDIDSTDYGDLVMEYAQELADKMLKGL